MKLVYIILIILSILILTLSFTSLVEYNKKEYLKAELNYECDLWAGEGTHTTESISKKVTITKETTYYLRNNETTLKEQCSFSQTLQNINNM